MNQFSVSESIKAVSAMIPAESAAAAYTAQLTVDRLGYDSAMLVFKTGTASGSPTTQSCTIKVQEGDESDGSDAADISADKYSVGQTAWTVAITTDETISTLPFQCTQLKRYLTFTLLVAFTGGSTPKIVNDATLLLGCSYIEPVA